MSEHTVETGYPRLLFILFFFSPFYYLLLFSAIVLKFIRPSHSWRQFLNKINIRLSAFQ